MGCGGATRPKPMARIRVSTVVGSVGVRRVFHPVLLELADQSGGTDTLMIDATHLKAYRTAPSLGLKKESVVV